MKTFKTLDHFKRRLGRGIAWDDWIRVGTRVYKLVEYGDAQHENYCLFQNKTTTEIIDVRYQVPCFEYKNGERVQTKYYSFHDLTAYINGELYRY